MKNKEVLKELNSFLKLSGYQYTIAELEESVKIKIMINVKVGQFSHDFNLEIGIENDSFSCTEIQSVLNRIKFLLLKELGEEYSFRIEKELENVSSFYKDLVELLGKINKELVV